MNLKDKVKALEKKYNLLSENMQDAIVVIDAGTNKIEYISPSIEKISGYSPDEYSNATIESLLKPESLMKSLAILAEEKKRFEEQDISVIHTMELERIKKNGTIGWIEFRARLYREEDQTVKIVGVVRDINERKKAELRQNELIEKLGMALAEKEKLLEEVKILRGLLPICSGCKRIRDENGKWWPMDVYITKKTDTQLTHTMCQDCAEAYYSDL